MRNLRCARLPRSPDCRRAPWPPAIEQRWPTCAAGSKGSAMNDDLPELSARLTPRSADEALRNRVLDAVAQQLSAHSFQQQPEQESKHRRVRWERMCEWSVAAALVLGIGLNVWQHTADEAWQTRLYGPSPITR